MVKVEQLEEKNMVKLVITVGADEFEKAVEKAYQKNKNKISVQGFRQGKAPRHIIEKMYGPAVFFEDAANDIIPEAYAKAVEESGLDIVSKPGIDVLEVGKGKDFVFYAEVAVKPEVKLGKYKGVEIDKIDRNVTEEDIENELKKVQEQNSRMLTVDNRPVQDGDVANIDYEGFADGVAFEGGKGDKYDLAIGSNSFIPGFESQIIGHSIGDEFDVNVTFPEEYHSKELAGKPAVFKCKVNGIKAKELPELDDDFAQDVSEFDTLAEYKEDLKKNLAEQKAKNADAAKEDAVLSAIVADSEMDIPNPMIYSTAEDMFDEFCQRLKMQGLTKEMYYQFTGLDDAKFLENIRPQAETRIKSRLVLEAVAKAENIQPSEEDVEIAIKNMADSYRVEVEKLKELINEKEMESIKLDVCVAKAVDFIRDNAIEK